MLIVQSIFAKIFRKKFNSNLEKGDMDLDLKCHSLAILQIDERS